jgi:hypothetical protein
MSLMPWVADDGGRAAAGFLGSAGDCGVRAFSIALGQPYRQTYQELTEELRSYRELLSKSRSAKRRALAHRIRTTPRDGLVSEVAKRYAAGKGWAWVPTMGIGTGCRVHLLQQELPNAGPVIVNLSKHYCAVVDGVIRDTFDPNQPRVYWTGELGEGPRCVYGVWLPPGVTVSVQLGREG